MAKVKEREAADNPLQSAPVMMVDTLMFTIKEKLVSNYRKLPQKQLYVRLKFRETEPCALQWELPGQRIQADENLDTAALRGIGINSDLEGLYLEQLYTFGDAERNWNGRTVSVAYLALISQQRVQMLEGEANGADGQWFRVNYQPTDQRQFENENGEIELIQFYNLELIPESGLEKKRPQEKVSDTIFAKISVNNRISHHNLVRELELIETKGIAFDHARIIGYGLERLKSKVEYTDVLFSLMPRTFTLSELQQVYELLVGGKVYTAQFRRKIEPKLTRLADQVTEGKGHRPAQRYQYNPLWQLKADLRRHYDENVAE